MAKPQPALRASLLALKFDHTNEVDGYNTLTEEDVDAILQLISSRLPKEKEIDYSYVNIPEEWLGNVDNLEKRSYNQALKDVRALLEGRE